MTPWFIKDVGLIGKNCKIYILIYERTNCRKAVVKCQYGDFIKIQGLDINLLHTYWVYLKLDDYNKIISPKSFNEVMENYPNSTKEFLLNGVAPSYHSKENDTDLLIHDGYLTNATANSVVFYANAFLNNSGLSLTTIRNLRSKYSLGNLDLGYFSIDELRKSFLSQSAFFLNIYNYMREHQRFENFVSGLDDKKFNEIFSNYENSIELKKHYNRKVFHIRLECSAMKKDYNKEKFYPNTGIFAEKIASKNSKYVNIEAPFLENLQMTACNYCLENI